MWKRGERKILADYKKKDFYQFYKDKYDKKALNYDIFWKIWNDFIDLRIQLVIYDNLDFTFPNRFGSLGINIVGKVIEIKNGEVKTKIDFGKTNKLWKELYPDKTTEELKLISNKPTVYYTNKDVDGKIAAFIWDKSTCNFKYHSHYHFKIIRKWQRKLAEYIKQTKNLPYYERTKYRIR